MSEKSINVEKNAGNIFIGESPEYKVDSAINALLEKLASCSYHFQVKKRKPSSETIEKINHNNIQSKQHIIKQYLDFSSKIEFAYQNIDSTIPFGKQIVIQNLNDLYYAALDEVNIDYFKQEIDMKRIRDESEFILDFIIQKLKNIAYESKNTPSIKEQIDLGINVIVAHAFIECVVLETPQ